MKYRFEAAPPHIQRIRRTGRKTPINIGDEAELSNAEYAHFTRMGLTLTPVDGRRNTPDVEPETEVPPIETGTVEPTTVVEGE